MTEPWEVDDRLFRLAAESSPSGVVLIDADGVIRFANAAMGRLFACDPDDLLDEHLSRLLPSPALARYLGSRHALRWEAVELVAERLDGTEFPADVSFTECGVDGHPWFAGTLRDISDRKDAEAELAERARDLELLKSVSQTILSTTDLETALERMVEDLRERFDLPHVDFVIVEEDGASFRLEATASKGERSGQVGARYRIADGGVVGRALATAEVQFVPDVAADPDYVELLPGVRGELAVPIASDGQVLGALNLETDRPEDFTEDRRSLIVSLADPIAGALRLALGNERLREANETLELLSRTDPLTRLANRRALEEAIEREWARALRTGSSLALILVDVDFVKRFTDTYGHAAGDECLTAVSQCLRDTFRRGSDLVARPGGDEFAVVAAGTDQQEAETRAARLVEDVEALDIPHESSAITPRVTVSVGVGARLPVEDESPRLLWEAADRGLYAAKRGGRNRARVGAPGS